MSHRRASVSVGVLTGLSAVMCLGSWLWWSQAPAKVDPAKLLPQDSLLVMVWDGFEPHAESWKKTAAYKSLVDSGLSALFEEVLEYAGQNLIPDQKELVQTIIDRLTQKGFSLAVSVEEVSSIPSPQAVVVLNGMAGEWPALKKHLLDGPATKEFQLVTEKRGRREILVGQIPETPATVGFWTEGEHLVVTGGMQGVDAVIAVAEGKAPNVTTHPRWKTLRTSAEMEVASLYWLDLGGMLKLAEHLEIPADAEGQPLPVKELYDRLKVKGLGAITAQSGFAGESVASLGKLDWAGPRPRWATTQTLAPMTLAELPPFPARATAFYAWRVNPAVMVEDTLGTVEKLLTHCSPRSLEQFQEAQLQALEVLGFDWKTELLDALGDKVLFFNDEAPVALLPNMAVAISLKDAEQIEQTLKLFLDRYQSLGDAEQLPAQVRPRLFSGREGYVVQARGIPVAPTWCVDKDWLIIGMTPQIVDGFFKRIDGKQQGWKPDARTQAHLDKLPKEFVSFSYSDPREAVQGYLALAPFGFVAFQGAQEEAARQGNTLPDLPFGAEDLPSAEDVVGPLFPNLAVGTVDENGFAWYTNQSFGLPVGGLSAESTAVTAVMVALILPAVQQAREAARRAQTKNNLKQYGLAVHNYHDTMRSFPQAAVPNAKLKLDERLGWQYSILPYLDQAPLYNVVQAEAAWNAQPEVLRQSYIPTMMNPSLTPMPVNGAAVSHFFGFAGVGADTPELKQHTAKTGVFGYDRVTRFQDILDGTSNTMMIGEAYKGFTPWMQGQGSIRALTAQPYIGGPDGIGRPGFEKQGAHVLMSDGSVRYISANIHQPTFEALTTVRGGEVIGEF